jgi:nitrite transporter NirC
MERPTIETFSAVAERKSTFLRSHPLRFLVYAMFAGAWVGLGITLIFSVGAGFAAAGSPALKLVMGASFAVALSLVIFAGAELFTGSNMIMLIGKLERRTSWRDLILVWTVGCVGNLFGSLLLAVILLNAGTLDAEPIRNLLTTVSAKKMTDPFMALFFRGVLCNILVCLAVWCSGRTKDDTAKLLVIFWCLFAFIGSGFEHSVANMTLLAMGVLANNGLNPNVTWAGYWYNMGPVILGNIVGGALVVGAGYWFVSPRQEKT